MTEFDFSQSGEQGMILEWARRHGAGRWLDIGAADGIAASNSRALALAGWPGVAVEAAAHQFDRLADLYRERHDIACVQAAIVDGLYDHPLDQRNPLIPFHYAHDLVSTTEQANADTWSDLVQFVHVHIASATVAELLHVLPGPYDFVSIDTEGTSVEIWDDLRRQPDVFTPGALAVVEAENGGERWEIQTACLEGWARVGVTPNNVLLERLT